MATSEASEKRAMSPEPLSEEDAKKGRWSSDDSSDGVNGRDGGGRRGSNNSTSVPIPASSILMRTGSDGSVKSSGCMTSLGRGMRSVSFHVANDGEQDDEVLGDGEYVHRHSKLDCPPNWHYDT